MLSRPFQDWPKTLIFLPKWWNFAKSGHAAHHELEDEDGCISVRAVGGRQELNYVRMSEAHHQVTFSLVAMELEEFTCQK